MSGKGKKQGEGHTGDLQARIGRVREMMDRKGLPLGLRPEPRRRPEPLKGVVVRETVLPAGYRHGRIVLEDLHGYRGRFFRTLGGRDSLETFDPARAVFLDTETTGLAGGAGTYAFLVGIGWFEARGFVVRQLLMPEPGEEREMLLRLSDDLRDFSSVVTFNGAAFDLPLLQTRYLMQGLRPSWSWDHHLDLLPVARKLWRGRYENCRLVSLEEGVFDFRRRGDIPGHAIPALYVRFLREGRLSLLEPVLTHNVWDVASMAALAVSACRVLEGAEGGVLEEGWDFAAAGGAYASVDERELSLRYFGEALLRELPQEKRRAVGRNMARILKSEGRREEAVEVWELLRREFPEDCESRIELAKHYEHRSRDLEAAREAAREALRLARRESLRRGGDGEPTGRESDCERRLARIERKIGGKARR